MRHPGDPDLSEGHKGGEDAEGGVSKDEESEVEGGPDPPRQFIFPLSFLCYFFCFFFIGSSEEKEKGGPAMAGYVDL